MNKALGIAFMLVGFGLIAYGLEASNLASSDATRALVGTPTNNSLWWLLGGLAAITVGSLMTFGTEDKVRK